MALDERGDRPVLYAGTLPPALYRSADLGEIWMALPALNGVPDADKWNFSCTARRTARENIAFHPAEAATLFVCIEPFI
jgi:hypothetical protein